jgi:hypothetical protein
VLPALSGDGIKPSPPDKRMIMSDMDFLIAQRYKHVVFLLSIEKVRLETFFPLCGAPSYTNQMMCLDHVNDNHFVMVYFKDGGWKTGRTCMIF